LGVVTLNLAQRDLIEELLENRLRSSPEGEAYRQRWESQGWPFFVKNLENVQGDERDVIFISTTFGHTEGTDRVRQNFGPISKGGGWRRLNVLFTRARKSVHIFTSMLPEDIVVDDTTPEGTRALRNYLDYARSGVLPGVEAGIRGPESDFEVSVAEVLRTRGFEVVPQLGVAGYFIDVAVRNPPRRGEFLAGIECDGASYHAGVSVRDRDRIRQEILESLGWRGKIYRIWSTDWFRNRPREIASLLSFLEDRMAASQHEAAAFVEDEGEPSPGDAIPGPGVPAAAQLLLLPESSDEEVYVEVGDLVTYCDLAQPEYKLKVRIVKGATSGPAGEVNENAPLARVLLSLAVGGEDELVVPGYPTRTLRVLKIERSKNQL
jgi:very-short-patch-repair endonuclease